MIVEPLRIDRHGLCGVRQLPSPNHDERPDPEDITLIVLHCISLPPGQFGGDAIDRLFLNQLDPHADPSFAALQNLRVSAHLLIRRDGTITQYVPFDRRAWHAGVSCFLGRERCNDFSIGIELEGMPETPYTSKQYHELARVLRVLFANYPRLSPERMVGHSDIAPGRKIDPGASFDWAGLHRLLEES